MDIKLGTYSPAQETVQRLSMLLWGVAGCGKTELALTAPGTKLFMNFDANGMAVASGRDDVVPFDFSSGGEMMIENFMKPDPFNITKALTDHPELETVVVDSTTAVQEMALSYGVGKVKSATLMNPTMQGYGYRKALTVEFIKNMLAITNKLQRNLIIIAHEDEPITNDDGIVMEIPVMLGGKIKPIVTAKITEIWNLSEPMPGKRRIAVRPCRSRRPMTTRMFECGNQFEFDWNYNVATKQGDTLAKWYGDWKNNGFKKIPLPVTTK